MKTRKGKQRLTVREKDDTEERLREMLELYTMVPPSPYVLKKRRKKKDLTD